jgi:hypothetical protein
VAVAMKKLDLRQGAVAAFAKKRPASAASARITVGAGGRD